MSLAGIIGWILWGGVALLAIVALGCFVWLVIEKAKTPDYYLNESLAGWALRLLLGLLAALLGSVAILFLENGWSKLHLLWVAPLCLLPVLLMGHVVVKRFLGSLEKERSWVEKTLDRKAGDA